MSRIAGSILVLFLSCLPQAGVAGPIIYDNGVNIGSAFSTPGPSGFLADNFQLAPGQTTVADIHWRGIYATPTPPYPSGIDRFVIRIFADLPGPTLSPFGAPILQEFAPPPIVTRLDTGVLFGQTQLHIFEYSLDLPVPITLLADTTYWLSIDYLGPLADNTWFWGAQLTAPGPGHAMVTGSSGSSWSPAIFNGSFMEMDFQLTGPSSVVPEPTSLALLALGLAGIGAIRRKRGQGQTASATTSQR